MSLVCKKENIAITNHEEERDGHQAACGISGDGHPLWAAVFPLGGSDGSFRLLWSAVEEIHRRRRRHRVRSSLFGHFNWPTRHHKQTLTQDGPVFYFNVQMYSMSVPERICFRFNDEKKRVFFI